jgi:hypothetical protein
VLDTAAKYSYSWGREIIQTAKKERSVQVKIIFTANRQDYLSLEFKISDDKTTCYAQYQLEEGENINAIGEASCYAFDEFVPRVGRKIAAERAIGKAVKERAARKALLDEYTKFERLMAAPSRPPRKVRSKAHRQMALLNAIFRNSESCIGPLRISKKCAEREFSLKRQL